MSGGGKKLVGTTSSAAIPSGSKKMVQSIREIVNCSEMEIYSMLKECNMDPSEAVHRLLSQDTFHEVKSKREKKKETKDIPEPRSRVVNNNSNRGPRAADRGGRTNFTQPGSNDYGVAYSKLPQYNVPPLSTVVSDSTGSNLNRKSPTLSEVVSAENTTTAISGVPLPTQPSAGIRNNWSRAPGQMSMADIVKMGRPQSKPFSTPVASDMSHPSSDLYVSNMSQQTRKFPPAKIPVGSDSDNHISQGLVSQSGENNYDLSTGEHVSHDGWSVADKMPAESGSDYPQTPNVSSIYAGSTTTFLADEVNPHLGTHMSESKVIEGQDNSDSLPTESIKSTSLSESVLEADNYGHTSNLEDKMLNGINTYQSQMHSYDYHEVGGTGEEISSVAEDLQQLNIHEESGAPFAEDNPAVIIPSHLQVTNADCSHLSFGSFGSGLGATYSGPFPSQSLASNLEEAPVTEEDPSFDQSHSRNVESYDNDQLDATLNEDVDSGNIPNSRSYDMPSASQPEIARDNRLDASHGIQSNFPSVSGYGYSATTQQPAAVYTYPESNSQMPNLSPFSSLMQPFPDSLPSSLLAQTAQPLRELDHPFSTLLTTQAMPLKYNTATSTGGPTVSISEGQSEVYSTSQSTMQNLPGANITGGGPGLAQHLPMHPYSQPTLPLGHFANMISYPFLPQSYTFLPSAAFQQAYAGSSPFHQSPAAGMKYTLPQYKAGVPATSLTQSPPLPPGYGGGFSSSANNIPGTYNLNPSSAASTTPSIEEAMSSLYKEGSHYLSPAQQNENSAMWLHGAGSRTMSGLPGNTFYGYQGQQNQHNGGYRQVQQQASPYGGPMGYMNYYQSQGGQTQEQNQHQQNPSEGNLSNSQGPNSHQMWQHGY